MRVEYHDNGEWVEKHVWTPSGINDPAISHVHQAFRKLTVDTEDGSVTNDGSDTETITVRIVNNLERLRGETPTVLAEDHTATVEIDGSPVSVSLTDGSGTVAVDTTKDAGDTITVQATALDGVQAERSDLHDLEVVQ